MSELKCDVGLVFHPTWLKQCQKIPFMPKNRVSKDIMSLHYILTQGFTKCMYHVFSPDLDDYVPDPELRSDQTSQNHPLWTSISDPTRVLPFKGVSGLLSGKLYTSSKGSFVQGFSQIF